LTSSAVRLFALHQYPEPMLVTRQVIIYGLFYWLLYALSARNGNKACHRVVSWERGKINA